jgi:hypothetical protein
LMFLIAEPERMPWVQMAYILMAPASISLFTSSLQANNSATMYASHTSSKVYSCTPCQKYLHLQWLLY